MNNRSAENEIENRVERETILVWHFRKWKGIIWDRMIQNGNLVSTAAERERNKRRKKNKQKTNCEKFSKNCWPTYEHCKYKLPNDINCSIEYFKCVYAPYDALSFKQSYNSYFFVFSLDFSLLTLPLLYAYAPDSDTLLSILFFLTFFFFFLWFVLKF